MPHFADRLTEATRRHGTPLCVGLDPFPAQVPALFGAADQLETVEKFFCEILDLVAGRVPVVKPQIGLFEPWGAVGVALVSRLARYASDKGLLVILDAKRGDIGSTADGYARAFLAPNAPVPCDCVTLNPYLGMDSMEPFAQMAGEHGKGIAVLVRTSNPGAKDFQDIDCNGAPLWIRVAEKLEPLQDRLLGRSGHSSLMVVCGATWPAEAQRLRQVLPRALFLVPGYGAQGGAARDALAGLVPGPACPEGGVVSSSRGILYPKGGAESKSVGEWRRVIQKNLEAALADLKQASEDP
jgi:orotidine-5'-phosphate decarboxylase